MYSTVEPSGHQRGQRAGLLVPGFFGKMFKKINKKVTKANEDLDEDFYTDMMMLLFIIITDYCCGTLGWASIITGAQFHT